MFCSRPGLGVGVGLQDQVVLFGRRRRGGGGGGNQTLREPKCHALSRRRRRHDGDGDDHHHLHGDDDDSSSALLRQQRINARPSFANPKLHLWRDDLLSSSGPNPNSLVAASLALSLAIYLTPPSAQALADELPTQPSSTSIPSPSMVLVDRSSVLSTRQSSQITEKIKKLQDETPWRLRIWIADGIFQGRASTIVDEAQAYFFDTAEEKKKSVLLLFDPSAPNAIQVVQGADAPTQLRGDFLPELRGRYGNMFYIRDNGPDEALVSASDVLVSCLESDGGCAQVPGLDLDQYYVTLVFSISAGLIAGFSAAFTGTALPTSPLWGPMLVAYGLVPLVQRDAGALPIAANFLISAVLGVAVWKLFDQTTKSQVTDE
ncbi:methanol dehydrogenase [Pycnococcus provasolii]